MTKNEIEGEKMAEEWVTTYFSNGSWNSKALNVIFFFCRF